VHAQLQRLGVHDHFSYRRDRTTGRLAGYVWLD
jgi:copper oxidase (laccase) domain-containing protein